MVAADGGVPSRGVRAKWQWDVALSFAGAQRGYVERVADELRAQGVRCFYDADEQIDLWGRYLAEELPAIYGEQAAVVVVFVSAKYAARDWTRLERRAALNKAVRERQEYVLPARFDDTPLPGLLSDMVVVDLRTRTPQQFAAMIAAKLAALGITGPSDRAEVTDRSGESRPPGAIRVSEMSAGLAGVHRAIVVDGAEGEQPLYVPRDADDGVKGVRAAVQAAVGGGGMLVLVGGSSVGKTRTLYEAVTAAVPDWWLLQPRTTSEIDSLAAERPVRAVVWLDELQRYLEGHAGLRVSTVHALLRAGPVLLAGTLWPEYHSVYTTRPGPGREDPYAETRGILELATVVHIGADLSARERERARRLAEADPRIRAALGTADFGFTQTIAAAPQLIARWRNAIDAKSYAAAILNAAIDMVRMGGQSPLSAALLEAAAPGYCDDRMRASAPSDWFDQACLYATATLHGASQALAPVAPPGSSMGQVSGYVLADYLAQEGRRSRAEAPVPASFWNAVLNWADSADLRNLAASAHARGLYWYASLLFMRAVPSDAGAALSFLNLIVDVDPVNTARAGQWVAHHAGLADVFDVCRLLSVLERMEAPAAVAELAGRAARNADLRDPERASDLIDALVASDITDAAREAADRAAYSAVLATSNNTYELLISVRKAGAQNALNELAARAAREANVTNMDLAGRLLAAVSWAEGDAAGQLAYRAATETSLTNLASLPDLVEKMHKLGAHEALDALLARLAVIDVSSGTLARLAQVLQAANADEAAAAVVSRIVALADPADPVSTTSTLTTLEAAHASRAFTDLAMRAADLVNLDNGSAVAALLRILHRDNLSDAAARLLGRSPENHVDIGDADAVADLLAALHEAGAGDAVGRLVSRNPANNVDVRNAEAVAYLLSALYRVGASEAVARLLSFNPAEQVDVSNLRDVTLLSEALRDAGAGEVADRLITRAAQQIDLSNTREVTGWLTWLPQEMRFDAAIADALLARDPVGYVDLVNPDDTARLLAALADRHDRAPLDALLERDLIGPADLSSAAASAHLLRTLNQIGASDKARELARALDLGGLARLAPPDEILELLRALYDAGETQAAKILIARYPTDRIDISDPLVVTRQLTGLREIGADEIIHALLQLDPAGNISLPANQARRRPGRARNRVYNLLQALEQAGANDQADKLAERASNVGLFTTKPGSRKKFMFGREPDGQPSKPWTWDDLTAHANQQTQQRPAAR